MAIGYRYAKGRLEGNAFSVTVAYSYARTAPKDYLVKVVRAEGISGGSLKSGLTARQPPAGANHFEPNQIGVNLAE